MSNVSPRALGPGYWGTVRYAIGRWDRTLRLCVILGMWTFATAPAAILVHSLLRY
ncbi:MAG TPA: hypothetical protein VE733_16800 [Streptosporangiaceae bacterium]|jgi:hypothetical protein|nr:hypothetical protein [Streptosporangiaceae bacterium]